MAYRVELHEQTEDELRQLPKKLRDAIYRKVQYVAANLPTSLRLRTVQPIKGQEHLKIPGRLFELDIGSGIRVAFVLYDARELLVVYMVGTHDYAKANYLRAAEGRLREP